MIPIDLPKSFLRRMSNQLGEEFAGFEAALLQPAPVSLRVNPLKAPHIFDTEEKIPWSDYGKFLKERPEFVFDPLIHAGAYYVQEASSQLIAKAIDFSKDLKILDLCASPGGKSTLLLSHMSRLSVLFSNELVGKRTTVLKENITKWGYPNVIITANRASDYKDFKGYFDVVLVDAPCSGEGMFRKNPVAAKEWNESKAFSSSIDQKGILENAVPLLRDGGLLIFSTCTFAPQENENNVEWLYKKFAGLLTPATLNHDKSWGLSEEIVTHYDNSKQTVYKCYPHKFKGEGLFISLFRVNQGYRSSLKFQPAAHFKSLKTEVINQLKTYLVPDPDHLTIQSDENILLINKSMLGISQFALNKLNVVLFGSSLGNISFKSKEFIPSHDLALSIYLNKDVFSVELDKEQAIRYLKKEDIPGIFAKSDTKGWLLAKYKGIPMGWLKVHQNRINNFYPKDWKIRKEWREE